MEKKRDKGGVGGEERVSRVPEPPRSAWQHLSTGYIIPDRPINWLTEPRTRLALCNRGAPCFSFQGVQERQPASRPGRKASKRGKKARHASGARPFPYLLPPAAAKGPPSEYYYPGAATATDRDRRSPHHLLTFFHLRLN